MDPAIFFTQSLGDDEPKRSLKEYFAEEYITALRRMRAQTPSRPSARAAELEPAGVDR